MTQLQRRERCKQVFNSGHFIGCEFGCSPTTAETCIGRSTLNPSLEALVADRCDYANRVQRLDCLRVYAEGVKVRMGGQSDDNDTNVTV